MAEYGDSHTGRVTLYPALIHAIVSVMITPKAGLGAPRVEDFAFLQYFQFEGPWDAATHAATRSHSRVPGIDYCSLPDDDFGFAHISTLTCPVRLIPDFTTIRLLRFKQAAATQFEGIRGHVQGKDDSDDEDALEDGDHDCGIDPMARQHFFCVTVRL